MSEQPISPLRQRMFEDMSMRRFVPDTQREYIRAVKRLAAFLGRSPDSDTQQKSDQERPSGASRSILLNTLSGIPGFAAGIDHFAHPLRGPLTASATSLITDFSSTTGSSPS
jgi:hypothetical protein